MRLSPTLLAQLLIAAAMICGQPAVASTIYKCRLAGGGVSYQDEPCPGRLLGTIRPDPPPRSATPAPSSAAAGKPAASAAVRRTPPPRAPAPSFKCTRPNGETYFSGQQKARRMLVPDAVAGQLAAGTAQPPAQPKDLPAAPPGMQWVQDQCQAATRTETCAYYAEQIAANAKAQQAAAEHERRGLVREGQRLKAIHNHRCN